MSTITRVCGDCWQVIRPDAYAPMVFIPGECARCGQFADTYRVTRAELALYPPYQPMCGTAMLEAGEARRDYEDPDDAED